MIEMFEGRLNLMSSDVTDHHGCALGKWYDNEGHDQFQNLEKFQQLGADHANFHALVADIVRMWNGGQQVEARKQFEKLIPHTTHLFGLLDEISLDAARSVAEDRQN